MRNYAHTAILGKEYTTDFGNVKVIRKHDDHHFEVAYTRPSTIYVPEIDSWVPFTDLENNYIVDSRGHFGYCWNNPKTLCFLD